MGNLKAKLIILNFVSTYRAEAGISKQALAEEIGVTRATINSIEKGNYNPSLELAFRLSLFFKTDINELFHLEDQQ